jgi:hypothetical protein
MAPKPIRATVRPASDPENVKVSTPATLPVTLATECSVADRIARLPEIR